MKRFIEYLVEGALKISGSITSITILLIIIFLFKEGSGLFKNPVVEEGYVLTVNRDNPVEHITSFQIKEIYDENITNWKELGGIDSPILVFRFGDLENYFSPEELGQEYENIPQCLNTLINREKNIIAFFPELYLPKDFSGKQIAKEKISPVDFFGGKEWYPTAQPAAQFGLIPLLLGTLWVSIGAILLALPFGISVAIYMAELASKQMRSILKPLIELLAGIPSVVFGFFGLAIIVPLVQKTFNLPVGETALSGSIVLAIMALPTIITVAEDALKNTPRAMKEASLALGATQWQTIYKVVIPYSISGITSAIVLGVGRAIGETMAVLMVTGNAAIIPHTLLEPVRTIPATIAAELGEAPSGGVHYQALFALGAILFLITLILSISVEYISNKKNK